MSSPNSTQVTLVDPDELAATAEGVTTLVLSHDSGRSTTISLGGAPLYRIHSVDGTFLPRTEVCRADGTALVSYDRRVLGGDHFIWPGGESVKVAQWLSLGTKVSDVEQAHGPKGLETVSFASGGQQYQWRVDALGQFALYREGAPMREPIAWYIFSKKRVEDGALVQHPATLHLREETATAPVLDDLIVSWLVANEKARDKRRKAFRGS